jgi:GNAT superfamily N-acetyltransferase
VGVIACDENWVEQLYVLPGFQGGRIGSSLLDRAKQAADELKLWTFQKNTAARGFYERQGFIAEKETDGESNEENEPDVLYRWQRLAE